jgi:hypothetical protein
VNKTEESRRGDKPSAYPRRFGGKYQKKKRNIHLTSKIILEYDEYSRAVGKNILKRLNVNV